MYTALDDRPGLANHNQTTLRLHWLTPLRKGGGTGNGPIGGEWAVSTDGGWIQKPQMDDRERRTEIRGEHWNTVDKLCQYWGSLEGGGNP
jgi:hypothetical protein